jgi:hypothetical protein
MVPAFVVAFQQAFEMGSQRQGSAAISEQIGQKITAMYAGSWLLQVGLIIIVGLLVMWRAWAVAKGSEQKQLVSGLIVGAVPAVLTLVFLVCGGFGWVDIAAILVYLVTGVTGGYLAKAQYKS